MNNQLKIMLLSIAVLCLHSDIFAVTYTGAARDRRNTGGVTTKKPSEVATESPIFTDESQYSTMEEPVTAFEDQPSEAEIQVQRDREWYQNEQSTTTNAIAQSYIGALKVDFSSKYMQFAEKLSEEYTEDLEDHVESANPSPLIEIQEDMTQGEVRTEIQESRKTLAQLSELASIFERLTSRDNPGYAHLTNRSNFNRLDIELKRELFSHFYIDEESINKRLESDDPFDTDKRESQIIQDNLDTMIKQVTDTITGLEKGSIVTWRDLVTKRNILIAAVVTTGLVVAYVYRDKLSEIGGTVKGSLGNIMGSAVQGARNVGSSAAGWISVKIQGINFSVPSILKGWWAGTSTELPEVPQSPGYQLKYPDLADGL